MHRLACLKGALPEDRIRSLSPHCAREFDFIQFTGRSWTGCVPGKQGSGSRCARGPRGEARSGRKPRRFGFCRCRASAAGISRRMYLLVRFKTSTSPHNRQLTVTDSGITLTVCRALVAGVHDTTIPHAHRLFLLPDSRLSYVCHIVSAAAAESGGDCQIWGFGLL